MELTNLIEFYQALNTDATSYTMYRGTIRAIEKLIWQEYKKL